jgi:hypothetical protein
LRYPDGIIITGENMPGISEPDIGQPLDVPYIYRLVSVVNDIASQVNDSATRLSKVKTSNGVVNTRTSNLIVFASNFIVQQQSVVDQGQVETIDVSFGDAAFSYPPIVVASPVSTDENPVSKDVLVTVNSVSNSGATISVRFNSSGSVDVSLNVMAVGVSSSV